MTHYEQIKAELRKSPKTWLVTGVAGFIGSNLLETLLQLDQRVVGLDNFATGHQRNLDEVQTLVTPTQWDNFCFIEGDIRQLADCQRVMTWQSIVGGTPSSRIPVDYVLHQAALGSVPRSLADPIATNETNITGFLNIMVAARDAKVQSFTYAASSSTYGDHPALPKVEENIGRPLSPYAVTKCVNELYADVFARSYGFNSIGLRYFNVFGPRQDPNGAYAAVIPKWTVALLKGEYVYINGDGENSRDFCYISNAVQANILAAIVADSDLVNKMGRRLISTESSVNQVYNIAVGDRTTLNELFYQLRDNLAKVVINIDISRAISASEPLRREFRVGDVRHSQANINKVIKFLGYSATHNLSNGLKEAMTWYAEKQKYLSKF